MTETPAEPLIRMLASIEAVHIPEPASPTWQTVGSCKHCGQAIALERVGRMARAWKHVKEFHRD